MKTNILPITQEHLENLTPFKLEIGEWEMYIQDGHQVDAKVKLHLPDETLAFFAEIRRRFGPISFQGSMSWPKPITHFC